MKNRFLQTALIIGCVGVIIGAFGAHYVADRVSDNSLQGYKTAVSYQFYHAFLMLIVGFNLSSLQPKRHRLIYWLILSGILLFSGSIYLLSTREITAWEGLSFLGPVTPIGGLLFIASWVTISFSLKREK